MPEPKPEGITAILTAYRRIEYLPEQIAALRLQTNPADEIWVWTNAAEEDLVDISALADRVVVSNSNWLFWGRFALGSMVRTGYVAFFDDDVLPQPRWFEHCLSTIKSGYDGILGGSGVWLPSEGGYSSKNKAGWNGKHLNSTVTVDLVGHAWFMRKQHLHYMWREEPLSWDNGEDIHLSYMALKHGGVRTYVPPHPENDSSVWSCRPDFGKVAGRKNVATFKTKDHKQTRNDIVDAYREDGWKIVAHRSGEGEKTFVGDLEKINAKIAKQENFSLARFGDGEMTIINGVAINLSEKYNGEHKYTPGEPTDEAYRRILSESLSYQNSQYLVGLPCRCCVGDQHCAQLRQQSQQPSSQLTWANIFVNANYPLFLATTVPLFGQRVVNMVCHNKANIDGLPFKVNQTFRVGGNAWVCDYEKTRHSIRDHIDAQQSTDQLFLFCAGVLSNMLIYDLTRSHPNNTYIDVGSAFDDTMSLGKTRQYLKGRRKRLKKVCVW